MFMVRVLLFALVAMALLAESSDLVQRLRSALAGSGKGDLAAAELADKDFSGLEQMLAQVKVSGPAESAELLSLRGAVAFLSGKMTAAVSDFRQAAALAPLKDGDTFTLAMALVDLSDDQQARGLLEELARKYPERSIYVYWLGRLDYDQRRYEAAVAKLEKATELDPKSSRAWDSLGLAFDMQGRLEQALAAFQKAVSLNHEQAPPSPWPPHNLGFLLLRMDQAKAAEAALRESLRYDPNLSQTYYYLARALEKEGHYTEAIDEYVSAVSGDTTSPEGCYSLAMLYRKMHRNAESDAMLVEYNRRKQLKPAPDLTLRQNSPK